MKPTYQSKQFVLNTPFCCVIISQEAASAIVNPALSIVSTTLSSRLQTQCGQSSVQRNADYARSSPEDLEDGIVTMQLDLIMKVKVRKVDIVTEQIRRIP